MSYKYYASVKPHPRLPRFVGEVRSFNGDEWLAAVTGPTSTSVKETIDHLYPQCLTSFPEVP